MICKFCGNDRKLIRAHVIPEGFFRRFRSSPNSLRLISDEAGQHEKRAPVGVYDKAIVCGGCESLWKTWDEYAQLLLADTPLNSEARYQKGQLLAHIVKDFDYDKLKLFFISILWRASASTQPFFSKIVLGPFEEAAKQHISTADAGGADDFAVILAKFDASLAKPTMPSPHKVEFCGVTYYRFYISGYVAHVEVDKKPCPLPLSIISLSRDRPLVIMCKDFRKSKELRSATNMLPPSYKTLQADLEAYANRP
jgi:hypothetical protein